jgi:hypothetical protein
MDVGLYVKCSLFLSDFNQFEFYRHILEKYTDTNFYENLFSRGRTIPCGRTDGQADTTKQIVVFRTFANTP